MLWVRPEKEKENKERIENLGDWISNISTFATSKRTKMSKLIFKRAVEETF